MTNKFDDALKGIKIFFDHDISGETSMEVGGKVSFMVIAEDEEQLTRIYNWCKIKNLDFMVIGDGTNLIFNEGYLRMAVVRLGKFFSVMKITREGIEAGASCNLQKLVVNSAKHGYDLSALAGIPGTVGGALYGNSGNICSYAESIRCLLDDGALKDIRVSEDSYVYRNFNRNDVKAISSARLKARISDPSEIFMKIREKIRQKKKSQPIKQRSAGCFFKNPSGKIAGRLIEDCGLKGFHYGGAAVSAKHANFIINYDNASAEDVYVLSRILNEAVCSKYEIRLENEVRMIGFEDRKNA